jgi:GT2 family glycosyltransferase
MADAAAAIERLAQAHDEGHQLVEQVMADAHPETDAVALAYVHHNDVAYSWHYSVFGLWTEDLRRNRRIARGGIIAMRTHSGQLTTARNQAVKYLLDSDTPWLLWVDTDMGFQPDLMERLLEVADPAERPIVGALCFSQRELGPDGFGGHQTLATPTIFGWVPADQTPDGEVGGFEVVADYPANEVVRCAATGAAAVLIHRSVFERITTKYGAEWYHRIPARDGLMGEDLSFCMRATALDIPIHVHTGVRTTHAKQIWLSEDAFLAQTVAPPATAECAVLVPVLGRPEHAEPFMRSLRASTGLATCYAICDYDDDQAMAAWKQAGAEVLIHPGLEVNDRGQPTGNYRDRPGTFAEKVNYGFEMTAEPWLLLVGSDVRFHPGWLDHAQAVASDRYHVVGTNDLGNPRVMAGEHATHLLIRRAYVDEVGASWDGPGVVAHEGYRHWHVDDELAAAARQRGVWAMALASRVEHLHPYWGKGERDEVYDLGESHADQDKALWVERLARFGSAVR